MRRKTTKSFERELLLASSGLFWLEVMGSMVVWCDSFSLSGQFLSCTNCERSLLYRHRSLWRDKRESLSCLLLSACGGWHRLVFKAKSPRVLAAESIARFLGHVQALWFVSCHSERHVSLWKEANSNDSRTFCCGLESLALTSSGLLRPRRRGSVPSRSRNCSFLGSARAWLRLATNYVNHPG